MMLDARTALVMGAGFMAITSISLALLTRTLPEDIRRSALYGVAATGALTLSWLLFALEGLAPEALTMVGANAMYALALTLVYQSVRLFDGAQPDRRIYLTALLPAVLVTVALRYVVDAYSARVVVMSLLLSLLLALTARQLFRQAPRRIRNPARRTAAYWLAITSGLMLTRAGATAIQGGAPPLFGVGPTANLLVALSVIVSLGAVFAYFLLFSGRLTAELELQAHLDPLTDLLNRRAFEARATQELKRAARDGTALSLLMVDANDFKRINDTLGHQAGDTALRAIANGLKSSVRHYDLVARIGGDEFAVLLPGLGGDAAKDLIPRLKQAIAAQPTHALGKPDVSIGRASLERGRFVNGDAEPTSPLEGLARLMSAADTDLYGAKHIRS